jgi:lipoate-protein ligase A
MALDEALLEHVQMGASLPTLRLFAWEPPCLSLGQAQPFADVDSARLQERGWQVVRRLTGGRAILHTDELTYSVTAPAIEPNVTGSVLDSYNRLAQALLSAAVSLGLPAELNGHKSTSGNGHNPVCFEAPSTYELTVAGKKLIGSAQARRNAGVLQHGSLPLTGDLTRICQALDYRDDSARRLASDRLLKRAVTVETALGRRVDWDAAAHAFIQGFETALGLCLEPGELSDSEKTRARQLITEKYAHPSWTERV